MLAIIRIFQTDHTDTALVTSRHTSVIFKMAGKFLVRYAAKDLNFPNVWRGVAKIFQRGGQRGYSPDCHVVLWGHEGPY